MREKMNSGKVENDKMVCGIEREKVMESLLLNRGVKKTDPS